MKTGISTNPELTAPTADEEIKEIEFVMLYHPSGRVRKVTKEQYENMKAAYVRPSGRMMGFGGMGSLFGGGGGFGLIGKIFSAFQNGLQHVISGITQSFKGPSDNTMEEQSPL
ncbi:MAG: hypothetical protein ACM3PP_04750 [Candidatus Saccharibacteria bacterium]